MEADLAPWVSRHNQTAPESYGVVPQPWTVPRVVFLLPENLSPRRERLLLPAKFRQRWSVALSQASVAAPAAAPVTGRECCVVCGLSHHLPYSPSCNDWAAASSPRGMSPFLLRTGCCGLQCRPPETILQRPSVASPPPRGTAFVNVIQSGQAHAQEKMPFLLGQLVAGHLVLGTNCDCDRQKYAPWGWQCCHQVAARRHAADCFLDCVVDCSAAAAAAAAILPGCPPPSTLHLLVQHLLKCLPPPANKSCA
mmetsp:Transcript_85611/g.169910  ORF Transcript_85611/g.169910 Transcript_85611/m.169910 type:complete len:252 (-) Transcript_85611:355-1110(-)